MITHDSKLSDIIGKDLGNFHLTWAYFLELSHGLIGVFPALITETKEPFVCLNESLLEKVKKLLPERKSKVSEMLVLATVGDSKDNPHLYFNLRSVEELEETRPFKVLSEEDINTLSAIHGSLEWAPGLIS